MKIDQERQENAIDFLEGKLQDCDRDDSFIYKNIGLDHKSFFKLRKGIIKFKPGIVLGLSYVLRLTYDETIEFYKKAGLYPYTEFEIKLLDEIKKDNYSINIEKYFNDAGYEIIKSQKKETN